MFGLKIKKDREDEQMFKITQQMIAHQFPGLIRSLNAEEVKVQQIPRQELYQNLKSLPRFYQVKISSWLEENIHLIFPYETWYVFFFFFFLDVKPIKMKKKGQRKS